MKWNWKLLRAGSFRLDGGAMHGMIPRPLWSRIVESDDRNRILLQTNCYLLESGGTLVLVEAGLGDKMNAKQRDIYDMEHRCVEDAVREAGHDPADISAVFISHLHFDHAAGLTRRLREGETGVAGHDVALTFPNAEIFVQRREWEDARQNKSTMHSTYLPDHLDPIADRVRLLEGETDAMPGIRVLPVPGHTWGQQAILWEAAGGGVMVFPGDLVPTVHHAQSTFGMAYDVESYTAMVEKMAFLKRAHDEGWTIALDHEVGNPIVRPQPREDRPGEYALVAADSAKMMGAT